MRNPPWTREESILALDTFFKCGRKNLDKSNPEVVALSQTLRSLPFHLEGVRADNFRNPTGVSMKIGNFSSLDPEYPSKGLENVGQGDREVWNEFHSDPERLAKTAEAIGKSYRRIDSSKTFKKEVESTAVDEEFPEGRILTKIHVSKERNRAATRKKKEHVLSETGQLQCEACDFDFANRYGVLGEGYIECHHTIPLEKLDPNHKTKLSELALLCANCHRVVHRHSPLLSVSALRQALKEQNTSA